MTTSPSTNILFLCPHNAAKSVAAAAFARDEATRQGLAITTATAGTEPDPEMLPIVATRLAADGHSTEHTPRVIDVTDVANADVIINIGCDHDDLLGAAVVDWQIPNFSDDPFAAFGALESHVTDLIAHLASGSSV